MKHIHFGAALAASLAGLCLAQSAPAPTANHWKLVTGYRAESFHTQNIVQFARDVTHASAGQLTIEVFPNSTLIKLPDITQAVQQGKGAQAGETIMTSMVKDIPIAGADSVPFVVSSYSDAQRLWTLQRPSLEKQFARRGLILLYAVPWPPQGLHSKKPIRGVADFKDTRMRTYNSTTVRIAELLGAKPVDVPMVDVGAALSDGRMDNMITSALTGVENKVWGSIKYYYEINAWIPKNIVFVNADAFHALPVNTQKIVRVTAEEAEKRGWRLSQTIAIESTNELKSHGIKVEQIPSELSSKLRRLGEKFSLEWVRTVDHESNMIFTHYFFN